MPGFLKHEKLSLLTIFLQSTDSEKIQLTSQIFVGIARAGYCKINRFIGITT